MNGDWRTELGSLAMLMIIVVLSVALIIAMADDDNVSSITVDGYGTYKEPQRVVVSRNCVRITDSDGNKHTLRLREDK